MYAVWYVLAICVGIAFGLGFIYMLLLRCCAGVMVFISLVSVMLLLGGAGAWLFFMKNRYTISSHAYKYCLYGAYAVWGIDGLYCLILLCLCRTIRIGVAVVKCTA